MPTPPPAPIPEATYEAQLQIGAFTFRIYLLADGRRLIDEADLQRFFGVTSREALQALVPQILGAV
jgi:hypothetical protein